jgi:hypothetical protein
MNKFKYFLSLFIIISVTLSCSLFNSLKEKLSSKEDDTQVKEQTIKEETVGGTSEEDLKFYNKYIDVVNKVQDAIEQLNKSYMENVPDPKTLKKGAFVLVITSDMYVNTLERTIKDLKRSLYDGGELSKLNPDNKEMKNEIENQFRDVLNTMEEYHKTSRKVIDYYKNKDFERDLSPAAGYDAEMKDQWEKTKSSYESLANLVKKYKPKRDRKDPDKISDPDEKSVAVLMNSYENTLDGAEALFEKFEKSERNGNYSELEKQFEDFEKNFDSDKNKVMSTEFTDMTKYMKYSFEDYFTKTVSDFRNQMRNFLDKSKKGNLSEKEYNREYDNVVTYYNYMINSYNTSIQTLNSFKPIKY